MKFGLLRHMALHIHFRRSLQSSRMTLSDVLRHTKQSLRARTSRRQVFRSHSRFLSKSFSHSDLMSEYLRTTETMTSRKLSSRKTLTMAI